MFRNKKKEEIRFKREMMMNCMKFRAQTKKEEKKRLLCGGGRLLFCLVIQSKLVKVT